MNKKIISIFIFSFIFFAFANFSQAVEKPNFTGEATPTVGPLTTTKVDVKNISAGSSGTSPDIIDTMTGSVAANATGGGGLIPCGNPGQNACTLCDFFRMFSILMKWGIGLMFILAVAGIVISGIIYIISAGNSGMMTKAKGYLTMCIVGVVIVLCAWLIVNTVLWLFGAKMTGVWFSITC